MIPMPIRPNTGRTPLYRTPRLLQKQAAATAPAFVGSARLPKLLVAGLALHIFLNPLIFAANNYGLFRGWLSPLIRLQGAAIFAVLLVLALTRSKGTQRHPATVYYLLLCLLALGSIIGLLRSNAYPYLAGDALRMALTLLCVGIGYRYSDRISLLWDTVSRLAYVALAIGLLGHLAVLATLGYRRLGADTILLLIAGLFNIVDGNRRLGWRYTLISIAAITLTGTRGLVAAAIFAILLYLLLPLRGATLQQLAFKVLRLVLVATVIAGLLLGAFHLLPIARQATVVAQARVSDALSASSRDATLGDRRLEIEAVRAERLSGEAVFRAFGFGFGAEFGPASERVFAASPEDQGARGLHSIHNTYQSVLFRHGSIGAALAGFMAVTLVGFAVRAAIRGGVQRACGVYILSSFVAAVSAYGLIGDPVFSLLSGALLGTRQPARSLT